MPNHLAGLAAPIRILVIDDDERRRSATKAAIEAGGYDVETAVKEPGATLKVHEGRYDLVLVEHGTRQIDSPATAELIRDLSGVRTHPRLVALLAAMPQDTVGLNEVVLEGAFDEVVARPADVAAMLGVVDRCLQVSPKGSVANRGGSRDRCSK